MSTPDGCEEWRVTRGDFEGSYLVSDRGRIRNVKTGRILKAHLTARGYLQVSVRGRNGQSSALLHRLICHAFHGDPPAGKPNVLHWDGDKTNNHPDNLRWGSQSENLRDAIRHGTYTSPQALKTHCKRGHPFSQENTYRPPSGGRYCRTCHNIRAMKSYYRMRETTND